MDTCKYNIVEGRRYRQRVFNPSSTKDTSFKNAINAQQQVDKPSQQRNSKTRNADFSDVEIDGIPIINQVSDNTTTYAVTIDHIPTTMLSKLNYNSSSCELSFSDEDDGSKDVTLTSPNIKDLHKAYQHIRKSLHTLRKKSPYTHFFCIPFAVYDQSSTSSTTNSQLSQSVTGAELMEGVDKLWEDIKSINVKDLDDSCRMSSQKLHVTLFLLKLYSKHEVNQAVDAVKAASPVVYDSVGSTSVLVNIQGLSVFPPNEPHMANVLYAKMTESGKPGLSTIADHITTKTDNTPQACPRLARIVSVLAKYLVDYGVMEPSDVVEQSIGEGGVNCNIQWHITLANNKYRNRQQRVSTDDDTKPKYPKRITFDARKILENLGTSSLGTHRAPCVQLCRLTDMHCYPKKTHLKGWYTIETMIPLP